MNTIPNELKISIIGASARIGNTNSVDEFWKSICEKKVLTTWYQIENLFPADQIKLENPNITYCPVRGAIQNPESFDHSFFGYSKEEAKLIDPQQRLLLEVSWNAIEDAGYSPDQLDTKRVGVFVATSENSYHSILNSNDQDWRDSLLFTTGNLRDLAPTRLSYLLNLHGPSMNIQSACSSSLSLVHQACRSLLAGDCDFALVAAAAVRFPQNAGHVFHEGGVYSSDGYCRPFSKGSSGTVSGNGVIAIVLQRFDDSRMNGSSAYANICHVAANNDGNRKTGFTAPSHLGQTELYTQLYNDTGIDVTKIGYIEAHGTATPLGDPIEFDAHTTALKRFTQETQFCYLGSVKSNIGHLDSAAGLAGLLKTALILKNNLIPGHPTFLGPNAEINLESSPFKINTDTTEWDQIKSEFAGVGALGIGGTNVFCLLEKINIQSHSPNEAPTEEFIPFSSASKQGVHLNADSIISYLKNNTEPLSMVRDAFIKNKNQFPFRSGILVKKSKFEIEMYHSKNIVVNPSAPLCFVFPGGGHLNPNELQQLLHFIPSAQDNFKQILSHIKSRSTRDALETLFTANSIQSHLSLDVSLMATFSVNHIISCGLVSKGLRPDQLMGHSLGEYNAAVLANAISLETAIAIIQKRAEILQKAPACTLISVKSFDFKNIAKKNNCDIISFNSNEAATLCCLREDFHTLENYLKNNSINYSVLSIQAAAHSKYLEPFLFEFEQFLNVLQFEPLKTSFTSSSQKRLFKVGDVLDASYWTHHLREPVHFLEAAAITSLTSEFNFIQIGTGFGLANIAGSARTNQSILSSLGDNTENQSHEFTCLINLLNIKKTPQALSQNYRPLRLPPYVFDKILCSVDDQKAQHHPNRFRLYSEFIDTQNNTLVLSPSLKQFSNTHQIHLNREGKTSQQLVIEIFEIAKKLEKKNENQFLRILINCDEIENPLKTLSFLSAATCCINQEFSFVTAQLVFIKNSDNKNIENLNFDFLGPILIDDEQIKLLSYAEFKIPHLKDISASKNICLLGGGGRVGTALCAQILMHSNHDIHIVGRSKISKDTILKKIMRFTPRSMINTIKNSHDRIHVTSMDIASEKEVVSFLHKQGNSFSSIIYMASASQEDSIRKSISDITIDDLEAQEGPKAKAFSIWHRHSNHLCHHIIFSSNAARLGGPGLSAYSFANANLNSIAFRKKASIINFDAFRFTFEDKHYSSNTKNFIDEHSLWEIFNFVLHNDPKDYILSTESYLDRLSEWVYEKSNVTTIQSSKSLKNYPPIEKLKHLWSEVLGVSVASLDENSHFRNLGGHSILAFRLAAMIKNNFNRSISMYHITKNPKLTDMLKAIEGLGTINDKATSLNTNEVLDLSQLLDDVTGGN